MRRGAHSSLLPISLAAVVALASTWVWVGIVDRVDQPFPGFLLLGNGVVASAGLAYWPATTREDLFQAELLAYDDIPYSGADRFFTYVEDLSPGTPIRYQFRRGSAEPFRAEIATRTFTATDATLLFGATFLSAIALLGVALAIRHLAPEDPASGCSLPLGIAGIWALTALDLYGPYHFFRVHAFAECLLAAGSVHMALVFPYQRGIAIQRRWLVPSLYGAGIALGVANQIGLYSPTAYSTLHRTAVAAAGLSFGVLVASQIHAFLRPKSMIARQRVTVLAIGTFFSMGPGLVVLLMGATADSGASENSVAWAGALFPISIAYAVLRADLLEVDSILRRSVTYILVSAIVGLLYALVVAGFESIASGADRIPRWVSILAFSCFCTFALLPIRERIQSIVDRIFFRSVYDFRVITQKTSARLARLIDREAIRAEIEQAVSTALRPEVCELEILAPNEERPRASEEAGETIEDRPDGGIIVRFRSRNRVVAELLLGRRLSGKFFSGEDRDLLAVLANQGAIAIENAHALEEVRELNRTLERRVRDRTAELADTLDQLQETQADLVDAERLAAVGEIAAGVAHEVNNPLNFARNSLRALEALVADVFDSPESRSNGNRSELDSDSAKLASRPSNQSELLQDVGELIGILGSGLDRTARLVSELRDFAAPSSREQSDFSLFEVLTSTEELARSTLAAHGICFTVEVPETTPMLLGDQNGVEQVFLNLVKNSIDALEGQDNPSISVTMSESEDKDFVHVVVADNGTGIEPSVVAKVFDPFFTTKEAGRGTGLGLALCSRITREHGGSCWINSEPARFTQVHLTLPIAKPSEPGESDQDPARDASP